MKTLSAPLGAAVANAITRAGHLVKFWFATPVCISSRGQVSFGGDTFVAADVRVSGIKQDGRGRSGGQVTLGNGDLTWSALILGEGVADKRIQVWAFDAAATGPADIMPIFDGVGDSAKVGQPCVVRLVNEGSQAAFSPRRFVGVGTGFNHLSPAGRIIKIGADTMTLERRD